MTSLGVYVGISRDKKHNNLWNENDEQTRRSGFDSW